MYISVINLQRNIDSVMAHKKEFVLDAVAVKN